MAKAIKTALTAAFVVFVTITTLGIGTGTTIAMFGTQVA